MSTLLLRLGVGGPEHLPLARHRLRRAAELLGLDAMAQAEVTAVLSAAARQAPGAWRLRLAVEAVGGVESLVIYVVPVGTAGSGDDTVPLPMPPLSVPPLSGFVPSRRLGEFRSTMTAEGPALCFSTPLPGRGYGADELAAIGASLADGPPPDPLQELASQDERLLRSLAELQAREEDLRRLGAELEDTNRGVVALYAELDQRAEEMRQASELKSRFLSNMSHEFRTPLNSILALARLLLDRIDGPLTEEQERQVTFIARSAENLSELVNDLLDIAKVEAGKLDIRLSRFTVAALFGSLRGVLKPLQTRPGVELVFDEAVPCPDLVSDEGKVAQILRNLVSNALKFTERGEVRLACAYDAGLARCRFTVRDTGIGIAPEDQERIFQEFAQIDSRLQRQVRGTGLGLPLSRKLAELLGGTLSVESTPERGSTFTLDIPARLELAGMPAEGGDAAQAADPAGNGRLRALTIDDDEAFRYVLRHLLLPAMVVSEASGGREGLARARAERPDLIFLDLHMPELDGFEVLRRLATAQETRGIPVIVCSSAILGERERERLGAVPLLPKSELTREAVAALLRRVLPGESR